MLDREAWCAAVRGVAKSWTRLRDWTELIYQPGWVLMKGDRPRVRKPDNGCSNYNWCLINSYKPGTLLTAFQALFYLVHPTTQCKRCYYCPILQMKTLRFGCQELAHKLAHLACQVALMVKNPPANAGDSREVGSIPESGRSPGGGNGNPL